MALIVIAAILLGIVVRVAFLQTTEADTLRSAGIDQWTRSVALPAQRGTVFDRYGNELAMSVPAATISINPKLVENGPATVQLLDDLLGLDDDKTNELLAEIAAKDPGFRVRAATGRCSDRRSTLGHATRRGQRGPREPP